MALIEDETLYFRQTIRRHTPRESIIHSDRRVNLKWHVIPVSRQLFSALLPAVRAITPSELKFLNNFFYLQTERLIANDIVAA